VKSRLSGSLLARLRPVAQGYGYNKNYVQTKQKALAN
jgi:hypothetical protein